jgi:hypothetical protein
LPAIPAVIGIGGAVAGGVSSGKGASKAAQIQADSARQQQALLEKIYNSNKALFTPDITSGDAASARVNDLLGLSGNKVDPTEILRNTPGYQFKMDQGLKAVNSNAYASGQGNSGATLKALLKTGQGIADQGFNNYLGQANIVADRGTAAKASLSGVSTNFANNSNTVTQNAADTSANYQLFKAQNFNNTLDGLLKAGGQAFGSSYGTKK